MEAVAPERILKWGAPILSESGGHRSGAKRRENVFGRTPPLFGSNSTISRFGERFRDGQYIEFGQFLCSSTHGVPRAQPSAYTLQWGHVPPGPHGVGATGRNRAI